ncbi:EAL domain-containing protein [Sphingobium nicotianae]|uniref:EAL domain-containing protein n=1 Tax=Sphingobium nicotianae TaxID=2782607 RepID=UPI002032E6CF|nr:EAL domain-containing protein [Sphingobium nicotianae]
MSTHLQVAPTDVGLPPRTLDTIQDVSGEARVTIRVDNFSHILSAYGAAGITAAVATVDLVLDQIRKGGCSVSTLRPGHAEISFGQRSLLEAAEIVEVVVAELSCRPVHLGDHHFHLAVTCSAASIGTWGTAGHSPSTCEPLHDDEGSAAQYHRDMQVAVDTFAALFDGRFHMSWQPVVAADRPTKVLYNEALARIIGDDGEQLSPALFVPTLERLGLVRAFDRQMVAIVLDELEAFPGAVLGVNISGHSARLDGWWSSLFNRLQRSDIADRLVVEITETAALPPEAPMFVRALRKLGCRVALDDFGVGHASVRNAISLCPDIVKIDAFFVRNSGLSDRSGAMLEHLIGIAGNVAPIVIVEGVEGLRQSEHAAQLQARHAGPSGECWQQGYHFGKPSFWRSWRHDGAEPRVVPLRDLAMHSTGFRPWFRAASEGQA